MFKKIRQWLSRGSCFVIADPRDNSITFSKELCRMIDIDSLDEAKVFAFEIKDKDKMSSFGFSINPKIGQETQLAEIMYNSKYRCVGFECLNPTVNRIFYAYNIPNPEKPCRLTVVRRQCKSLTYYEICNPKCNK